MRDPQVGDCYASIELQQENIFGWVWRQLWSLAHFKIAARQIGTRQLRLVTRRAPWMVYFRGDCCDQTHAAWLAEWHEWAEDTNLVADKGVVIPVAELRKIIGESELPFDMSEYQPQEPIATP